MNQKIFFSYAPRDRAFAESLKLKLREFLPAESQALDVVDAHATVTAGEDIRKAIKAAIDKASTVVIVSSPDGNASEYVNYEAGLADALGKDLVIVGRKGMVKSTLSNRFLDSARFIEVED